MKKDHLLLWLSLLLIIVIRLPEPFALENHSVEHSTEHSTNLYWGDTHLHTNLSVDAYVLGNKRLGIDTAYRFARGDVVQLNNGMKVRLVRPLDFLVIADHEESIGSFVSIEAKNNILLGSKLGQRIHSIIQSVNKSGGQQKYAEIYDLYYRLTAGDLFHAWKQDRGDIRVFERSMWEEIASKADAYNEPGKFTTFIGYEWTSAGQKGGNLHRVVVFRDDAKTVTQVLPFSRYTSRNPKDLWKYLGEYEKRTGGQVIAIPHNSNLSNGEMFFTNDFDGSPFSKRYADMRSYWEPVVEVTQTKGDSETHPLLSPNDEFADYERWNSWAGRAAKQWITDDGGKWEALKSETKRYEYARSALKLGLQQQSMIGVNPFKFGMIGSTDAHTALSAVEESNFLGKTGDSEPGPSRLFQRTAPYDQFMTSINWEIAASGLAAIWATENTRSALFAALKRKEVYATTGPRINIRFFGGWEFSAGDEKHPDLSSLGYRNGIPMGSDLTQAPDGASPTFLIRAIKDPYGANLDRIQMVKGWLGYDGQLYEKVFNVALSDERKTDEYGKVPRLDTTVDTNNATYSNTIGAVQLATVWKDPDFNPEQPAFYYARVLEIETPRWTAYDVNKYGIKNISKEMPLIIQERAYTSPIWYTP